MSRRGSSSHLGTIVASYSGSTPTEASTADTGWKEGFFGQGATQIRKLTASYSLLAEKVSAVFRSMDVLSTPEVFLCDFIIGEQFCSTRVTKESGISCLCIVYGGFSLYGDLLRGPSPNLAFFLFTNQSF